MDPTSDPPDPPARPDPPDGPVEIPAVHGYEVLGLLGRGGTGAVWRARHTDSGRVVALKVLSRESVASEQARLRFDREVRLAGLLDHPHIVRVHDVGSRRGVCFFSMELIDGLPLDEFVRFRGLDDRRIAALMRGVCRAVDYAHSQGVIHRDLKPSNILIDAGGDPHLLDFGLARSRNPSDADPTLSLGTELSGTLAYMSPEQAAGTGEPAGTRSDVYSLGVILYRLLTGHSPHDLSGSALDVLLRLRSEDIVPPRRAAPALHRELETILLKALARGPGERYASASAMADDLNNFLDDEPLAARRPGTLYFLRKRLRRHLAPLAVAAGVLVALLALWAHASVRIARERDLAVKAADAERKAKEEAERLRVTEARARHDADESWHAELKSRRVAQAEALDLAWALAPWADALGAAGDWARAGETWQGVGAVLRQMDVDPFSVRLCLADAALASPPPLAVVEPRAGPGWGEGDVARAVAASADGRSVRLIGAAGGTASYSLDGAAPGAGAAALGAAGERVMKAAFSADGRFAAVLLYGRGGAASLAVWDAAAGKETARWPLPGVLLAGPALSADGGRVVFATVAGADEVLWLWDVADGKEPRNPGWRVGRPHSLTLSPDGGAVFTAGLDAVRAWSVVTGRPRSLAPMPADTVALSVGDGGRLLVGLDAAGNLATWDVASGAAPVVTRQGAVSTRAIAASPAGGLFAAAGSDGRVKLFEVRGREHRPAAVLGDGEAVRWLAFSLDGRVLLSAGDAARVKVWDVAGLPGPRTAPSVPAVANGSAGDFTCADLSPDGRMLLTGDSVGNVRLSDRATGRELLSFVRPDPVACVAFSPDGATARSADLGGGLTELDLNTGRVGLLPDAGDRVLDADFSSDGRLALCGTVGRLRLVEVSTGEVRNEWQTEDDAARVVRFSPDGAAAVFTDGEGEVTCLDVGAWRRRWSFAAGRRVRSIAVTRDGSRALVGLEDGTLLSADMATGDKAAPIAAHAGPVTALACCPDDRTALSAGPDGVRLWHLGTGRILHALFRAPHSPRCLLAEGDTVACGGGGADGVWLWDLNRPTEETRAQARGRSALGDLSGPSSPPAAGAPLRDLAGWYATRGRWDWAAPLLRRAAAAGEAVPDLDLARAAWGAGDGAAAAAGFEAAGRAAADPAERRYLRLCEAATRGGNAVAGTGGGVSRGRAPAPVR